VYHYEFSSSTLRGWSVARVGVIGDRLSPGSV
jgi:hypothetical protein